MPTPLCMECQHLTSTNYSLPKILSLWFCLLFAIFQQVSDSLTSTSFLLTTGYSSKSLHLPIRPWQTVSNPIFTISFKYTTYHELSVLQPNNFSMYHIRLLILVGAPSATALLQHGTRFLSPLKTVCPYIHCESKKNKALQYCP